MSFVESLFDEKGIVSLVLQGSGITHAILVILLLMSSFSWAVIFLKWIQFRRVMGENEEFLQLFHKEPKLEHIHNLAHQFEYSPLARIFEHNYQEVMDFREKIADISAKYPSVKDMRDHLNERLERSSGQCITDQYTILDQRLNPLASISSSSPFIGLFGTVLGIIDAFQGIGVSGVTSLAVVAPGISEALIATAAGLLAAIPALMAYNHYRSLTRREGNAMRNFSLKLTNRLEWVIA
ncbi:MAG: MotA/TolQ/ExbB proton channel family protein [SAR324 cluster bacterium]|nr:MotA/TolQ/ExbB proton channel family protein [SAR324 cluster bacterium]